MIGKEHLVEGTNGISENLLEYFMWDIWGVEQEHFALEVREVRAGSAIWLLDELGQLFIQSKSQCLH